MDDVDHKNPRVQEMLVMGSLLSNEADTMSAMKHCMNKAMSAMRAEMCLFRTLAFLREESTAIHHAHNALEWACWL